MKKAGVSHIEMILAFVLFAGAVGFGLYFLNPVNPERLTETTTDYVYREVSKNVSVGIESFSVKITKGFLSSSEIEIDVDEIGGRNARVENAEGLEINSTISNGKIAIDNSSTQTPYFILIRLSEDLPEKSFAGTKEKGEFKVASSNYEEVFSERRMLDLNRTYYSNYSGLKKEFNIPERTDFGFELKFSDSDFIKSEETIPSGLEVFSNSKRVEVLRKDGKINFAEFIIRIW